MVQIGRGAGIAVALLTSLAIATPSLAAGPPFVPPGLVPGGPPVVVPPAPQSHLQALAAAVAAAVVVAVAAASEAVVAVAVAPKQPVAVAAAALGLGPFGCLASARSASSSAVLWCGTPNAES